ncbi:MarR family transcriptional regulator [Acetobacter pasteurianus NBRC 101655]|nr:MarR family transcriptional regulator [Acetobacter pasteurianus]BAU39393.1 MarR family transcriptional regulator [Acetobacter pasteurianus NBRC 101655]CCT59210.1 transcriptional regulator, MarR family [Acetobacter pasteurianus 386B]
MNILYMSNILSLTNEDSMTSPRVLPTLDETRFSDMALTFRIMRLATVWRTQLDRALRPHGMTLASMRPMAYLMMMPDGATQSDLAAAMNVDCSALVRILDLLEKQKLITRLQDTRDRRAKKLVLTSAGQERCALFHTIAAQLEQNVRQNLNEDQVRSLIHDLSCMLETHHER